MTCRCVTARVGRRVRPDTADDGEHGTCFVRGLVGRPGVWRSAHWQRTPPWPFAGDAFRTAPTYDIIMGGASARVLPILARKGCHVPRPTLQADGRQAGVGSVHFLRRADQHQGQRQRGAGVEPDDGRRDGAPDRLRPDDEGAGARVRERARDEPVASRQGGRQLPDQHLPPARHRSRSSFATCATRCRRSKR